MAFHLKDLQVDTEEPICAPATPLAESALAVVRLCGKGSLELLARLFSRPRALLSAPHRSAVFGTLRDPEGHDLDDAVILVWRAPGGYTGQDGADLMLHGSPHIVLATMESLQRVGFRRAGPGEFTLRAFLNGKLDLTQAEAVASLIRARTARSREQALRRLHGGIRREIDTVKETVLGELARVNIQLDYAEDDVPDMGLDSKALEACVGRLRALAASAPRGRLYQEGLKVALAGAVNAGKSSLFNRLLQEERSIVSQEAGTTRDYLEGWISLDGIPLRLYDTAGLREADNPVESEGIRRSLNLAESADLILYVADGTDPRMEVPESWRERTLLVWNKVDLAPQVPEGWVGVSALTGEGWPELMAVLRKRLERLGGVTLEGEVLLDSLRQAQALEGAAACLEEALRAIALGLPPDMVALDLQEALHHLGEVTGEVTTADVLNRMFSSFCVGK